MPTKQIKVGDLVKISSVHLGDRFKYLANKKVKITRISDDKYYFIYDGKKLNGLAESFELVEQDPLRLYLD